MSAIALLIPKRFPATESRKRPWRLIGREALDGAGADLDGVRGIAAAGHMPIGRDLAA